MMNARKIITEKFFDFDTRSVLGATHRHIERPISNTLTSRFPIGTNIFDRDWDLLVILDACRYDALRSISHEYPWFNSIGKIRSVGSMSAEWVLKTFTHSKIDKINNTAYVSGNLWPYRIMKERLHENTDHEFTHFNRGYPRWDPVNLEDLQYFELVYPLYLHSQYDDRGKRFVPLHFDAKSHMPHIRTDRAIAVGRKQSYERMIVHYMLPHNPYTADALEYEEDTNYEILDLMNGFDSGQERDPNMVNFRKLKHDDNVSVEQVWDLYIKNLKFVLEYVEILLENFSANKVIITSDHGESFGDRGLYKHPFGTQSASVRHVPWVETEAKDEETYVSKYDKMRQSVSKRDIQLFLQDMGYK